jgi:hypothetical protein
MAEPAVATRITGHEPVAGSVVIITDVTGALKDQLLISIGVPEELRL